MRVLIIALMLVSAQAMAGIAKLNWTFDNRTISGAPVTVTQFRVYYGANGQPLTTIINLGPPAPSPWKVVSGVGYYAKTLTVPEWVPASQWCFQMSAWAGPEESARSNQRCFTFPEDPNAPVLIDIVAP